MAEELYSENESLDRIVRLLKGETIGEAPNALVPPLRSTNESLSEIAELLGGTLEGSNMVNPIGIDAYGSIFSSIINGAGVSLVSGTWTYVPFAGDGQYRNTTPDHTTESILIAKPGKYLVGYDINFAGSKDVEYSFAIYYGNTVPSESYTHITLRSTGTYHHISATMISDYDTAEWTAAVIVSCPSEGANFALKSGRLWVKSL